MSAEHAPPEHHPAVDHRRLRLAGLIVLLIAVLVVAFGLISRGLAGQQLLADRQGWLRARGMPGRAWSTADLVCRSGPDPARASAPAPDPLGTLVAAMDADPVVARRGGYPH